MNSTRTVAGIASALLLLAGCGSSDAESAEATSSAEASESAYAPTPAEQEFIDTFHDVVDVNAGGEDGPVAQVVSDVRYVSAADTLDIVTTWGSEADVDGNTAEALCSVAQLAEVQAQDVLATSVLATRVVSSTGAPLHTCS